MKSRYLSLLFVFIVTDLMLAQKTFYSEPFAHTYSIVARDSETGEMGVAVQSHWFSVGSIVAWGEAGVGVIATQSFVNVSFGPRGLALLKRDKTAQQVVEALIASDEGRDVRQLAVLSANGSVDAYTGKNCIPDAGHYVGENFSVQANLMLNDKVWSAMAEAFEDAEGPLAEHMNDGDLAVEHGDMELAMKEYSAAEEMFPDNEEMKYWHAVTLVNNGGLEEALPLFKEVFAKNENWKILTPRLVPVGLLKVNDKQLKKILSVIK
jgi:hypothetical protein